MLFRSNIDGVAERGVVFERAYVTAPWTLPSVHSMFASEYSPLWLPGQNIIEWGETVENAFFDLHEPTIAELYREKGFKTAAIIGNSLLDNRNRLLRGMDTRVILPNGFAETHNPCAGMPLLGPAVARLAPVMERKWPLDTTRRLTAYARRYLAENRDQPVFLWIHYMDPHGPYNPPPPYRDVVTEYAFYPPTPGFERNWDPAPEDPAWVEPEQPLFIPHERLYAGEVRYVDTMLGDVLACLSDKSWVVIGADHGEEFLDHGRMSHGVTFYEEMVHVPLIIAGPGIEPRRVPGPVSYIDLAPTLAAMKNIEPLAAWQGQSLLRFLEDGIAAEGLCYAGSNNLRVISPSAMAVQGERKLILSLTDGSVELYDLASDPKEKNNLAGHGLPPEAEVLKDKAAQWAESVTERHRAGKEAPPPDPEQSEELRKQFEALGYM